MKTWIAILVFWLLSGNIKGQGFQINKPPHHIIQLEKGKSVKYNSLVVGTFPNTSPIHSKLLSSPSTLFKPNLISYADIMVGGNHVAYRKTGFGLSWRVNATNFFRNRDVPTINFDTASRNGWLTGNTRTYYTYSISGNFVFALTKKIPFYIGIGATRKKQFVEIKAPFFAPEQSEWQVDPINTKFMLNFGAGIFIPITNRLIFNLGYDHLPQTFVIGFAISGPYNYEDIDMW